MGVRYLVLPVLRAYPNSSHLSSISLDLFLVEI
jgi:hypothetical protein